MTKSSENPESLKERDYNASYAMFFQNTGERGSSGNVQAYVQHIKGTHNRNDLPGSSNKYKACEVPIELDEGRTPVPTNRMSTYRLAPIGKNIIYMRRLRHTRTGKITLNEHATKFTIYIEDSASTGSNTITRGF